jgi:hypothetical protein
MLGENTGKATLRVEKVFPGDDQNNRNLWRTYLPLVCRTIESDAVEKDGE